jgi:hypothetical protein
VPRTTDLPAIMNRVDEDVDESTCNERRTYRERWRGRRRMRRRFLERYEHRRAEREAGRHHPLTRPIRVTSGVVLILIGVAIGWLPGPGFVVFAFPGALLIASEWRRAAALMDRVEHEAVPWIRHVRAKLRGGPKPEWVEEDPAAWGVWEDRRVGSDPDTGQRRRRRDTLDTRAEDVDDDAADAEAHSA